MLIILFAETIFVGILNISERDDYFNKTILIRRKEGSDFFCSQPQKLEDEKCRKVLRKVFAGKFNLNTFRGSYQRFQYEALITNPPSS